MPKLHKACEVCGKEFDYWPSTPRRFCSMACNGRAASEGMKATPAHRAAKPRRGDEIACDVCGTTFYRGPTEIRRNRRFCSVACNNIAQRKDSVVKPCAWCGKQLRLKPSQARVQYCSKACEGEARMQRPMERLHNGRRAKQDDQGYVMLWEPSHPNKTLKGWQYEHRLVAETQLGRRLESHEHVHHINGVKHDNRPENLVVLHQSEHAAISAQEYQSSIKAMRAEVEEYRRRFGSLD